MTKRHEAHTRSRQPGQCSGGRRCPCRAWQQCRKPEIHINFDYIFKFTIKDNLLYNFKDLNS